MRLEADRFLIATGSQPFIPSLEGLDKIPFLTSDLLTSQEDVELKEQPESLTIVGGGYIALQLGQFFSRLGTRVTIIEPNEHFSRATNLRSAKLSTRFWLRKKSRS
jgi:mercuric reductase